MHVAPELSPWSRSADSVLETLGVDAVQGLDDSEVAERRVRFGRNVLRATKKRRASSILKDQFSGIVTVLLLGAGALALVMSDIPEAVAIFAVILLNAALGFVTEWRAVRSMEALRRFARSSSVVLRGGVLRSIPSEDLVPGDIVILEAGAMVPADLRVIEAAGVNADESTLTGESLPVAKGVAALPPETTMFERCNMVYKGTAVTRGSGKGVVTATGADTEFGKIFEEVSKAAPHQTPLEKRLDALGRALAWAVIVVGLLLAFIGILTGREIVLAIQVAIALAVAAIPEGLPIVATIALASGLWRMAAQHALITRLSAVETLGATSVILTDKTGTLTENRMTVTTVLLPRVELALDETGKGRHSPLLDQLLQTAALCNDASLRRGADAAHAVTGSPTERALLEAAAARDIWQEDLLLRAPKVRKDPFDPDKKCMATVHEENGRFRVCVKGAPEVVIDFCSAIRDDQGKVPLDERQRTDWLRRTEQLCERGLRVIAVAEKTASTDDGKTYTDLVLQGVFGIEDPPRKGIKRAIDRCHDAGVAIVMVTGDHATTARNVAVSIGIIDAATDPELLLGGDAVDRLLAEGRVGQLLAARVFSRVTPEQKLRLIELHQRQGHIVAMTGDGINDAPALEKADIGVAMGVRGTAVAREAADMVLQDDELGTVVSAIGQGRAIFENIRKFVVYLLSCNTSEVLVVTIATVAGAPLPLLPLQILFLNLVTDVFPALALGVGPGRPGLMEEGPRPSDERILPRRYWFEIVLYGVVIAATTLGAMAVVILTQGFTIEKAVTVAFGTIALAQLWHVFNMRGNLRRIVNNEIVSNPWVWASLLLCLGLVLTAVYTPVLSDVLRLADPGVSGWAVIVIASIIPLLLAPVVRHWAAGRH